MIKKLLHIKIKTLFALVAIFTITIISLTLRCTIELNEALNSFKGANRDYATLQEKLAKLHMETHKLSYLALRYQLNPTQELGKNYHTYYQYLQVAYQKSLSEPFNALERTIIHTIQDKINQSHQELNVTLDIYQIDTLFDQLLKVIEKRKQAQIIHHEEAIEELFHKIFLLLLAMVLFYFLVMALIRKKVLLPIHYLLNVIKSFLEGEKRMQKPLFYHDEIGEMSEKFFQLKSKLDGDLDTIRQLAEKDFLTGIYNRGTFFKKVLQSESSAEFASLVLIDIDFFKEVNDTYGHLTGDKILIHVVENIKNKLVLDAIFARYGGEEFIILLPNYRVTDAYAMAKTICEHIASTPYIGSSGLLRISVTLSIGVAPYDRANALEESIKAADQALYRAKANGRNQVVGA